MRYAYKDLGSQREGRTAVVRWGGTPATVMLFDPVNFTKYIDQMPCYCTGGRYRCPPARLPIPHDGRWYAVVDLGAHTSAKPPTVELEGHAQPPSEHQQAKQARSRPSGANVPSSRRRPPSRSRAGQQRSQSQRRTGPRSRRQATPVP